MLVYQRVFRVFVVQIPIPVDEIPMYPTMTTYGETNPIPQSP